MILRSAQTALFSQFQGGLQQPHQENDDPPTLSPLKSSLTARFIRWLLIGVFILAGYFALLTPSGLKPAQGAVKLATAVENASPAALENQLAGERLFQTYTVWLQTSHAHADLHGQDAPLPNQF